MPKYKRLTAVCVVLIFLTFQWGTSRFQLDSNLQFGPKLHFIKNHRLNIRREYNSDLSLSPPFLDTISKHWHVKGNALVKNYDKIRLTQSGQAHQFGLLVSNGFGDSKINNFEIMVDFSIDSENKNRIGDGLVITITSENQFMIQDLHSSYAKTQYQLNQNIDPNNQDLMGFPKSLPGLSIVIDTHKNDQNSNLFPPFFTMLINSNSKTESYDILSDGVNSTSQQLVENPLHLKPLLLNGNKTRLRIIYLETIGFLKIDISYSDNTYWNQLFLKPIGVILPKHRETGERYIGIGALSDQFTETVNIYKVSTCEFHWDKEIEGDMHNLDDLNAIYSFLEEEYDQKFWLTNNDLINWNSPGIQGLNVDMFQSSQFTTFELKYIKVFMRLLFWFSILIFIYLISVYLRVLVRRSRKIRRHKRSMSGILGY